MSVPRELRTRRVLLRPWSAEDAAALLPVLEANQAHIAPWIPRHVSRPAPVAELAERLAGCAADFAADREWRYGMVALDDGRVLGELALFSRSPTARVPYADAAVDRAEIGYWLRADATGGGLVTESASAVLRAISSLPRFTLVEIRCDSRNAPSAAVPRRLGFTLSNTIEQPSATPSEAPVQLQVWTRSLPYESAGPESDLKGTRRHER